MCNEGIHIKVTFKFKKVLLFKIGRIIAEATTKQRQREVDRDVDCRNTTRL